MDTRGLEGGVVMVACTVAVGSPLPTVCTVGAAHEVAFANTAFSRLVARPCEALVGAGLLDAVPGGEALRALLDRALRTGHADCATNLLWGAPGNATRYCTVVVLPATSPAHGERGLLVQIVDTTDHVRAHLRDAEIARDARRANEGLVLAGLRERDQAERAVSEAKRWNALIENLTEGVTVVAADGHVLLVNPLGRDLLGLEDPVATLADYDRAELRRPDGTPLPREAYPVRRALRDERFTDEELIVVRRDGTQRRLLFSGNAVRDAEGEVALAVEVYRDVTDAREMERSREECLALVSHDLRRPLTAAIAQAEILQRTVAGRGLTDAAFSAQKIVKAGWSMAGMIEDLAESSRIESGRVATQMEPTDLALLVTELVDRVGTPGDRARVEVEVRSPLPRVRLDAQDIERALGNLVSNALKYSPGEAPVRIEIERRGASVLVAVRDRGAGIPSDELPRVFEKFHRVHAHAKVQGLGLGLYIARRIVEAHGGRVWAESEVGRGSVFYVSLPIGDEASASEVPPGSVRG